MNDLDTHRLGATARAVATYGIVDTPAETYYDSLVRMAATVSGWPIALLSFFDGNRQWYKAAHGLEIAEADPQYSFCVHTIGANRGSTGVAPLIVSDLSADERFGESPYVTGPAHLRAYAGFPIRSHGEDLPLGTLALCHTEPTGLSPAAREAVEQMVLQLEQQLQQRREVLRLKTSHQLAANANRRLQTLSYALAHDLRAPLRRQLGLTDLLAEEIDQALPGEGDHILALIRGEAVKGDQLIRELLTYIHSTAASFQAPETFDTKDLWASLQPAVTVERRDAELSFVADLQVMRAPKTVVRHILINVVNNALRHHDRPDGRVGVTLDMDGDDYRLTVADDGPGVREDTVELVDRMSTEQQPSIDLNTGIGLKIVSQLVQDLGGRFRLERRGERGTLAVVTWPRPEVV